MGPSDPDNDNRGDMKYTGVQTEDREGKFIVYMHVDEFEKLLNNYNK